MWFCGGTSLQGARRAGKAGLGYWLANSPFDHTEKIVAEYRQAGRKAGFPESQLRVASFKNGFCIAGGLEFLQGMDMRIASDKAIFGLGEVKWGVIPAGGTHIRLPQQIPWAVAMEMVLAGDNITAERAYQIGLVNKIVPTDQVLPEAMALAERICKNGPLAVRTAKEIMVRSLNNEPGFVLEKTMADRVFRSEDAKEGPRAFAEKRKPVYTGK